MPRDGNRPKGPPKLKEYPAEILIPDANNPAKAQRLPVEGGVLRPSSSGPGNVRPKSRTKLSFSQAVGLAAAVPAMVYTVPHGPAPVANPEASTPHFAHQSLSDGDIDRLIQNLTATAESAEKPAPEHLEYARVFFRELSTTVTDPVKLADAIGSALISLIIEETIRRVRGKKSDSKQSDSKQSSDTDESDNPIVTGFRRSFRRVCDCFPNAAAALTFDDLVALSRLPREQVQAVLTLGHFQKEEDELHWMLPPLLARRGQQHGVDFGRAMKMK
jgi:hypothetical protein